MIKILPLSKQIHKSINKYSLQKKFIKQLKLLSENYLHPSLHFELLEPKEFGFYSFRIDKKFRALCFFRIEKEEIEIIKITVHYQ